MAPTFPYSAYPTAIVSEPITFYIGPFYFHFRFDIHEHLLTSSSPLFLTPPPFLLPRIITSPISLTSTHPLVFNAVCRWLYEGTPPAATYPPHIVLLCKMWVALGKLGMWQKQNTIMRIGMAVMQPQHFVCDIETVAWVYKHTQPGCKLRGWIIAIWCQRGGEVQRSWFSKENEKLGIFRDAVAFTRDVLNKVRAGNPKFVDRAGMAEGWEFTVQADWGHGGKPDGRYMATLTTFGKEHDLSRVEYQLPKHLIWGDKWEDLPDAFFVGPKDVAVEGREVLEQLEGM